MKVLLRIAAFVATITSMYMVTQSDIPRATLCIALACLAMIQAQEYSVRS